MDRTDDDHTDDIYVCTLTDRGATDRIDADRALARRVLDTERTDLGLRLVVDGDRDGRRLVETFVENERRCCGFFDLAVSEEDGSVVLEITAPPDDSAQRLVDDAERAFALGPDAVAAGRSDGA